MAVYVHIVKAHHFRYTISKERYVTTKLVHFAAVELFLFSHRIQKNIHSPQPRLQLASHLSRHLSKTKTQIRMSAGATSRRWTKTLLHLYKVKIHRLYGETQKVWGLGKVSLDGVLIEMVGDRMQGLLQTDMQKSPDTYTIHVVAFHVQ